MPHIEHEIVINRPVEEVFDFLADVRNEPHYNLHLLQAKQLSIGPIGRGTQFRSEGKLIGPIMVQITSELGIWVGLW